LIDSEGHLIHIDFGFILSIAPGGSFRSESHIIITFIIIIIIINNNIIESSVETAPFKLTEEMVEVLGGLDAPYFGHFLTSFTKGFIALQSNAENIVHTIEILAQYSTFPCFSGN